MKQWLETRQVFAQAAALRRDGVPAALATVIRVRGSAYRHEGAKLILADDGRGAGNVSGGCLEEDVREVAHRVIATGVAERRAYCGGANEVAAWDLGVGCEGEVDILIEPVRDDFAVERGLIEAEVPFVVITRLDTQARLAVTGEEAREWLEDGRSQLVTREDAELFIDVMVPPPRLLVVSAGHDARHLARLANEVGFRVVVADRRPGLLAPERFPSSVRLVETDAARLSERVVLDDTSYAVVMTHHFADDTEYVRALLRGPVRYVGLLGPRQRTERILATLRAEGPVDDSRIYGPVGLDIGTDGAEQVALSVLAEILAVRSGRGARSLRERKAPIHAGR